MKPLHVVMLFLAVGVGLTVMRSANTANVLGAKVVGGESTEVCWHGIQPAQSYKLYYGQESTGTKDSAIYEGLDNRSRCVKLSSLKPCTTYIWNLSRLDGGKWKWQWESDQRFSTGGTCESAQPVTTNVIVGNGLGTATWTIADGAVKYYVFYRAAGDANWTHSVEVPAKTTTYTINYLDPNSSYMYRVAALVNGKLLWQEEKNLVVE